MKTENPFVTQGYVDAAHFCDREAETMTLVLDVENGRHVTLLAPRRYGKSGLIHHAFRNRREWAFVYVDLLATTDAADFVRTFANAVVGVLDSRLEKAAATFVNFFKSVRPTLRTGSDGEVGFSFELANASASTTLDQVFDYLARKTDREIVIAFDEFQQVAKYPEKGVEAQLRSRIQFLPRNIHFVFAGSQMHLLGEMFSSPKRPFYQSTSFLPLDVIPCETYRAFAAAFFKKARRGFDASVFDAIYRRFDGVTWYVQTILNELWASGDALRTEAQVELAVGNLVARRRLNFHDLDVSQSASARALLRAIARVGCVKAPTSSAFLSEQGLPSASTVAGALKQLLANELIYKTDCGYVVYDRFLGEYLRRI